MSKLTEELEALNASADGLLRPEQAPEAVEDTGEITNLPTAISAIRALQRRVLELERLLKIGNPT